MARRPPSQRQYVPQPMPGFVAFQHPKLVDEPPAGAAWLHEIKFDGYRVQVHVEGGRTTIYTRNGHDWTERLPELAAEAAVLPDCILDAELCAIDAVGRPTFSGLRAAMSPGKTGRLVLFVFDVLWRGADDLRTFALKDRKDILGRLLADAGERLRPVEAFPTGGNALLLAACKSELEGIVSKRRDAPYRGGRGDAWVKSKCRPGQEVVIGGWAQERGRAFKALFVGVYEGDQLRYIGSVKTGFAGSSDLVKRLQAMEESTSPFQIDAPRKAAETRWARPELVANVEFAEWTDSGKLRQASFKGLRDDKDPRQVRREVADDVL